MMTAPTEWRTIPSCPDYEASNEGQVRRRFPGKVLKSAPRPLAQHPGNKGGYLKVALWLDGRVRQRWLHRLVCEAFHGLPPSAEHQAAHEDGLATNCRPDNLRWALRRDNYQDNIRHGTSKRGEGNSSSKLTDAQVLEIRRRAAELPKSAGGKRIRKGAIEQLATEFGVSARSLRDIASLRNWSHL